MKIRVFLVKKTEETIADELAKDLESDQDNTSSIENESRKEENNKSESVVKIENKNDWFL